MNILNISFDIYIKKYENIKKVGFGMPKKEVFAQ